LFILIIDCFGSVVGLLFNCVTVERKDGLYDGLTDGRNVDLTVGVFIFVEVDIFAFKIYVIFVFEIWDDITTVIKLKRYNIILIDF